MSLVQNAQSVWIQGCLDVVAPTILFYDYFLTLPREIELIWAHPTLRSSIVFFVNRYIPIVSAIVSLVFSFAKFASDESTCKTFFIAHEASIIFSQVVVSVLLALRIVALHHRDRRITAILVGAFILLLPLACWSITGGSSYVLAATSGCHIALDFAAGTHVSFAWVVQAIWDILVFGLMIRSTVRIRRFREGRATLTGTNLVDLVWRDGAFYFGVMAIATLFNIGFFYVQEDGIRGIVAPVTSSISVSMMSRLFLNLHEAVSSHGTVGNGPDARQTITLLFASRLDDSSNSSNEEDRNNEYGTAPGTSLPAEVFSNDSRMVPLERDSRRRRPRSLTVVSEEYPLEELRHREAVP
ncbi:hypothetical protein PENSPDRAFT_650176 [Peniophora sp. CONT]|nr:hypothetical protein PENSPDRAFT_650176 [Peniophora sp. CONT]